MERLGRSSRSEFYSLCGLLSLAFLAAHHRHRNPVVVLSAVNVHYVPIMVWKRSSEQRAAFFLAAQALVSLPLNCSRMDGGSRQQAEAYGRLYAISHVRCARAHIR